MNRIRVIPVLSIQNGRLVKSVKFKDHQYIGDPINAVKIFNEKEVDEIVIIDISATANKTPPPLLKIKEITDEAFMPLAYGGGITTIRQVNDLMSNGVEKVILNKIAHLNPQLIRQIADRYGVQSTVISIDYKKNLFGKYKVYTDNGRKNTGLDPVEFAKTCEKLGAGEILLNSIDRDGTFSGYETQVLHQMAQSIEIPVVSLGGAGKIEDFKTAVRMGASAVAAGSLFVYMSSSKGVLINYLKEEQIKEISNG